MVSEILAVSAAWSRALIGFTADLDPWVRSVAYVGTDLFLGVLGGDRNT
ncbi:hypothetical protein HGB44_00915 [Nocardiopsis dassonvillei subsp. albirubida]|uniref:Uncharacterized protein n=1 Tax=Nocardiopsis alborubida TaxID=146802 RepID=A0A7X6M7V3_9ACTN|nr:hypothetical protein [Nocardiopsis alborubida]NKY96243.1 hypothetical protein [Nocardiopsis alborubida]